MPEECVVVRVEGNRVVGRETVIKDLVTAVKDHAKELINLWNPEESDFIILRVVQTVSLRLPLNRELYNKLERYGVKRVGDRAEANIPTYEIIYGSKWMGEDIQMDKMVIIMPNIDEEVTEQVVNNILNSLAEEDYVEE